MRSSCEDAAAFQWITQCETTSSNPSNAKFAAIRNDGLVQQSGQIEAREHYPLPLPPVHPIVSLALDFSIFLAPITLEHFNLKKCVTGMYRYMCIPHFANCMG